MNEKLKRSREVRRQMTADIAHELRTPLSIILGHSEAIQEGVLPPTEENVSVIRAEAVRLERLVEDLRLLSLVEAGELPLETDRVEPKALLDAVAAAYSVKAKEKAIRLEVAGEGGLPRVEVDPDRMNQVLGNLLTNAIRHTPEGGFILLLAQMNDGGVEFRVRDSGPGIEPEVLPFVFDRFYRTDRARQRDQGGSGLGLAIAKSLTEAQGGTIRAGSEPGQGTTFTIEFPIPSA